MGDTTEFLEGEYVKAIELDEVGELAVIMGEHIVEESDTFKNGEGNPKRNLVIPIQMRERDRKLTLNKTSHRNIVEAHGKDSKDWIGKKIKLTPEKITMGVATGKFMILVEPVEDNFKLIK